MGEYLLGIDIGTSACKIAVFAKDGTVKATGTGDYQVYYPHPGWAEQNPEEWWEAVCDAIPRVLVKGNISPEEIKGIGIDGQSWSAIAVDKDGNVLGHHKGIIGYTVGQRKGLGIAAGKPVYVTKICPAENRVILGDNEDLFHRELDVEDFNFISFDTPPAEFRAKAKVRYRQKEQWATVKVTGEHSVHIIFDEPQRAITKGQAAVLYDGDVVIGGGVITG